MLAFLHQHVFGNLREASSTWLAYWLICAPCDIYPAWVHSCQTFFFLLSIAQWLMAVCVTVVTPLLRDFCHSGHMFSPLREEDVVDLVWAGSVERLPLPPYDDTPSRRFHENESLIVNMINSIMFKAELSFLLKELLICQIKSELRFWPGIPQPPYEDSDVGQITQTDVQTR